MAVRRRFGDRFRGERASSARAVLDEELLAEVLRQPLRDQARISVAYAAGREARYDPNGVTRIALSPRDPRIRPDRYGSRCKMQKFPTGRFHNPVPALRNAQRHREATKMQYSSRT